MALALAVVAPPAASAQSSEASRVPPDVRAAHELLFAAYPDLARRALAIHLKPDAGGVWLVTVDEVVAPSGPAADVATPAPTAVLLRARIAFDRANRLLSFDANGPYLFDRQNADLREAVAANPRWIESDADVHLMRMGAEPTVGRAFASEAPPDGPGVGRHLGSQVSAGGGVFQLRAAGPRAGETPQVAAVWVVEAQATDAEGRAATYHLSYEPIGGRLVRITRVGEAQ
jgi:hypothetical protein